MSNKVRSIHFPPRPYLLPPCRQSKPWEDFNPKLGSALIRVIQTLKRLLSEAGLSLSSNTRLLRQTPPR
jgi:hypothetical protein